MKIHVVRPGEDPQGPPALLIIYAEPHERDTLSEMIAAIVAVAQKKITPTNNDKEDA